jgi:hypothetical protein
MHDIYSKIECVCLLSQMDTVMVNVVSKQLSGKMESSVMVSSEVSL